MERLNQTVTQEDKWRQSENNPPRCPHCDHLLYNIHIEQDYSFSGWETYTKKRGWVPEDQAYDDLDDGEKSDYDTNDYEELGTRWVCPYCNETIEDPEITGKVGYY